MSHSVSQRIARESDSNVQLVQDEIETEEPTESVEEAPAPFGDRPFGQGFERGNRFGQGARSFGNQPFAQGERPLGQGSEDMSALREVMSELLTEEVMQTAVASALNLTLDELKEAQDAGQKINEIAEEQGVIMEEIQFAVQTAVTDVVNQAVADGTLTADQILNRSFSGKGHRGGHGFHGQPMPPAQEEAPVSEETRLDA